MRDTELCTCRCDTSAARALCVPRRQTVAAYKNLIWPQHEVCVIDAVLRRRRAHHARLVLEGDGRRGVGAADLRHTHRPLRANDPPGHGLSLALGSLPPLLCAASLGNHDRANLIREVLLSIASRHERLDPVVLRHGDPPPLQDRVRRDPVHEHGHTRPQLDQADFLLPNKLFIQLIEQNK